ncbi:MAG: cytochrome c peroxidase [Planctomycetota bacterium]|nr:cytochrome c peroxidase [Planctomycetota bacterium]
MKRNPALSVSCNTQRSDQPGERRRFARFGALRPIVLPLVAGAAIPAAYLALAALPPVPVPPENPITESKRVLGKILFWDEQLSSDNTMSCASCHLPELGGVDARRVRHPGFDDLFNTPDDVFASPGVLASDSANNLRRDASFALAPQVTDRATMTNINAAYTTHLFWDGRASPQFVDPQTSQVAIVNRGALESQAVAPPVSSVEMAHADRDWVAISSKLASDRPLAAAKDLPPDVAAALAANPTYPQLFQAAFGTSTIDARSIAFAIATYQRTLVSDQAPWDRFQAGETTALTPQQQQGLNTFNQASCNVCHTAPFFAQTGIGPNGQPATGALFRNIGLRPPDEDLGRQIVTGIAGDRGRFKVPSLRNVGLRQSFMHNGQFTTLQQVVRFYTRAPGSAPQFQDNIDPVMGRVRFPPQAEPGLVDFLANALTDPRVANRQFPFDHPSLASQRPADLPTILPGGTPGSQGVPSIFGVSPGFVGNHAFRAGLANAPADARADLLYSWTPPVNGNLPVARMLTTTRTGASSNQLGLATAHWTVPDNGGLDGRVLYLQWSVIDPTAQGGVARSAIARVPLYCGGAACPPACADFNFDFTVDFFDYLEFAEAYSAGQPAADFNRDGQVDFFDYLDFSNSMASPCE